MANPLLFLSTGSGPRPGPQLKSCARFAAKLPTIPAHPKAPNQFIQANKKDPNE